MMTSTSNIRNAAESVGIPATYKVTPLIFKEDSPAPTVTNIGVPLFGIADVSYRYDAGTNSWPRSIGGEAHIDALNGAQISPKNVIIQYVDISASDIEETPAATWGLSSDCRELDGYRYSATARWSKGPGNVTARAR